MNRYTGNRLGSWVVGYKYTYMNKKDYKTSRFKVLIRIDPKQREFLRLIRGSYTFAGKLDEIINHYKKCQKGKFY